MEPTRIVSDVRKVNMNYYQSFCAEIKEHGEALYKLFRAYDDVVCGRKPRDVDEETAVQLRAIYENNDELDAGAHISMYEQEFHIEDQSGEARFEVIIEIIQLWMTQNAIKAPFKIQYSHNASRPTPDAYGGGVIWIWPDYQYTLDTSELMSEDAERIAYLAANLVNIKDA